MNVSAWTVQDYAKHYTETIYSQPNGWGQHVSPVFGPSHTILRVMSQHFDPVDVVDAIADAFREHRNGTHATNA
jgi:hypothetical protein